MKLASCCASSAVMLLGLTNAAWAQQAQSGGSQTTELETVVVTGSLIRGTPVDAALPVEVFTAESLQERGSPTALEFAKSLTISGPTTGEVYYFGGPATIGSVNYNLRGIGSDKTLILMNGRRMAQNTANIPAIALARTEILKDGAAVTYGGEATGGVVNFITRDDFVGLQMDSNYKYVNGSDGNNYRAAILGGVGEDRVNFMWAMEWEHKSRLSVFERNFSRNAIDPSGPNWNPSPWSTFTNVSGWVTRGPLPAEPSRANEFGAATGLVYDFTQSSCEAIGGRYVLSAGVFYCGYPYIAYYNLVEPNDIYRGYLQLNAEINDHADFHFDASFGNVVTPHIFASPSQPIIRGPTLTNSAVYPLYVPITNPYAAQFAADHGVVGASGFTPIIYRAMAFSPNYIYGGDSVSDRVETKVWRVSAGLKGTLGDWAGPASDVGFDLALTYNKQSHFITHPDIIGYRLQEALNGFGGPNCQATDLDPARFGTQNPAAAGQGDCMWWNPFSSSFAENTGLGLANPNYVPGSENSMEVVRWMFDDRAVETLTDQLVTDLVFDGTTGIDLPGGEMSWALGAQLRLNTLQTLVPSDLSNGTYNCPWPDGFTSANGAGSAYLESNPYPTSDPSFRGCTPDEPGVFVAFTPTIPEEASQRVQSYFAELQIPVLDSLDFQAAGRYEEFSGNLNTTVYKIAGKWNVWGPLSFRGAYGTNYQTPPLGVTPGEVTVGARTYNAAGGNWLGARFVTQSNLKPETATSMNFGAIWQSDGFTPEHQFRVLLDYFDIETKDQIGQLADPNQIANLVFNGPGFTTTTCDPAVQPLINRITFTAGCTVGMSGTGAFSTVTTDYGNGPGQTTKGFDLQMTYDMPAGPGRLTLDLVATKLTELKTGPTELDGVTITTGDDRLGFLNFQTFTLAAPEWRANFSANYRMDRQNFRLGVNYISAVEDERPASLVIYGKNGKDWITGDFTWRYEWSDDLMLTATIENILDTEPPHAQNEMGYDPWIANPLGRTFQLGARFAF